MQRNKIILAIVILAAALVAVLWWYPKAMEEKQRQRESAVQQLSSRIVTDRDCNAALDEAVAFLQKDSQAAGVWNLKGACEFDLGLFAEARMSFEQVLALNPDHEAAKNYLEQLDFSPGEVVVTAAETPVSQAEFESRLGLGLNGILSFESAVKKPSNIPEYALATYSSEASFAGTVAALESELEEAGGEFNLSEGEGEAILASASETERKVIMIQSDDPVRVFINYQRLE
jgi:tetratricopeptide (TPR) repeat protein